MGKTRKPRRTLAALFVHRCSSLLHPLSGSGSGLGELHVTVRKLPLLALLLFLGLPSTAFGAIYYVDDCTGCSDSNTGLSATYNGGTDGPFRTVQHAANVAGAGDTVNLRQATYQETVSFPASGTSTSPIIFQNYQGEPVTIDANGLTPQGPTGKQAALYIGGQDFITINGIRVTNSAAHGIMFDSNSANDTVTNSVVDRSQDGGIATRSYSDNLTVSYTEVYRNNQAGSAAGDSCANSGAGDDEAITISGSVNAQIHHNYVHDNCEEGVDVKYNPNNNVQGTATVYNNILERNTIDLYVDGGKDVAAYRNVIGQKNPDKLDKYGNPTGIGVSIAIEDTGTNTVIVQGVDIYDNVIFDEPNRGVGLGFETIPASNRYFQDINLVNNTLYGNGTNTDTRSEHGSFYFVQNDSDCGSPPNGCYRTGNGSINIKNDLTWDSRPLTGPSGTITSTSGLPAAVVVDYDLCKNTPTVQFCGDVAPTGHSLTRDDPVLIDPDVTQTPYPWFGDGPTSPAKNVGDGTVGLATTDFTQITRSSHGGYDIGAFEYASERPDPIPLISVTRNGTSLDVDWLGGSSGSVSYNVYERRTNAAPGAWRLKLNSTDPLGVTITVRAGVSYEYYVAGVNSNGKEGQPSQVCPDINSGCPAT
jgi:Right handed beta helix region